MEWGDCSVKFFVKEDKELFYGILTVPPQKITPVDEEHPSEECVYCNKGSCTLTLFLEDDKKEYIDIKEGNSLMVPKNLKHQWQNKADKTAELIFVLYM